jgi:hypothetical protein
MAVEIESEKIAKDLDGDNGSGDLDRRRCGGFDLLFSFRRQRGQALGRFRPGICDVVDVPGDLAVNVAVGHVLGRAAGAPGPDSPEHLRVVDQEARPGAIGDLLLFPAESQENRMALDEVS